MQLKKIENSERYEVYHKREFIGIVSEGWGGWYFKMKDIDGIMPSYLAPGINYKSKNLAAKELVSRFKFAQKAK